MIKINFSSDENDIFKHFEAGDISFLIERVLASFCKDSNDVKVGWDTNYFMESESALWGHFDSSQDSNYKINLLEILES
jgi:hypothetical protein